MSLLEFEITAAVARIMPGVWKNCKTLPCFSIAEANEYYKVEDGVLYTKSSRELVQYPAGKKTKEYTVASGTTEIDASAFFGNDYLESVTLPQTLKEIGISAFGECTRLREVYFNAGLRTIGNAAFSGCRALKEVKMPGNTEYTQGTPYGDDSFPEWTKVRI